MHKRKNRKNRKDEKYLKVELRERTTRRILFGTAIHRLNNPSY